MKPIADQSPSTQSQVSLVNSFAGLRMTGRWFLLYALVALAVIFCLPRLISTAPSASDSYLFGYNNRAGILLLFFFVAGGVALTRGFGVGSAAAVEFRRLPRAMLLWSLALVAFGCAVMYLFAGRYNGFGESFYLIDRIWLLHMGRVPYRDFEFAYGPAQLYGPLILDRLLHIGIPQSYYLFWASSYLFGTYFLFKAVDCIDLPSTKKPWIFALIFGAGLFAIIRMGTNYTFLRYALPLYLVLQIHRRFKDARAVSILVDVLQSITFCALLVLLSPEMAVAFAFAALCICVLHRNVPLPTRAIIAGLLIASFALTFIAALRLHILDAMLADGGGAISFPIVPSPTILFYFAAVFVCACYLYRSLSQRTLNSNGIGLVVFSIPMVAAALGRCDPSHVFWNGMAAFLASLLFLSINRRTWIAWSFAFLVCVFLAPNLSEFYLFVPQLRSARFFNKNRDVQPSRERIESFLGSWPGEYIAPFGFRPDGFGTYHSPRIEFGRFEDLIDVSTPYSVEEKVSEMRGSPEKALILPYRPDEYCRTNQRAESHFLEVLLLFPHIGNFVHADFARAPICRYMDDHYRMLAEPAPKTFWYGVWIPKSAAQSNMPGSD